MKSTNRKDHSLKFFLMNLNKFPSSSILAFSFCLYAILTEFHELSMIISKVGEASKIFLRTTGRDLG